MFFNICSIQIQHLTILWFHKNSMFFSLWWDYFFTTEFKREKFSITCSSIFSSVDLEGKLQVSRLHVTEETISNSDCPLFRTLTRGLNWLWRKILNFISNFSQNPYAFSALQNALCELNTPRQLQNRAQTTNSQNWIKILLANL